MRKILLLVILVTFFVSEMFAVPADPHPFKYTQPDGTVITIRFKGDEVVSWAETMDGYKLLNSANNGYEYATLNSAGNLQPSGIMAHEVGNRTPTETSLLNRLSKGIYYSKKQLMSMKSSWEAVSTQTDRALQPIGMQKVSRPQRIFSPNGKKKLLLILIDFTDKPFNNPAAVKGEFNGLLNTVGYSANGAHGSVHDFFYESSYGKFDLTTDVVGPYHAAHDMAYYGANTTDSHSPKAKELVTEAVVAANADVNFADYANADGTVEGVYVVYAGYGEATSHIENTIWPHASNIPELTLDDVKVSKYSCSNELEAGGTTITSIGVICHEFGHVCGSKDYYDTDAEDNGKFQGNGDWDVMDQGVYNGIPKGSQPPHFNPYTKIQFGWATPTELSAAGTYTTADIASTAQIYKINTKTVGEYFLLENRQQTLFNASVPGHGLMIYRKGAGDYTIDKNTKHPQGFYPVCAGSTTTIPTNDPASYGDISSASCPFPGSTGKTAFYDGGTPSAKSWVGVNTEMPITNITENADGTVSFTVTPLTVCGSEPTTQSTAFAATPSNASSMGISWVRGNGDKVIVVAREGSAVDFDPLNGTAHTANASFKSGDEIGNGNFVVYNGTGTSATVTNLDGNVQYYFSVYEYNSATNCYLKPALTGSGTTNCNYDPLTFTEDFERSSFGCWSAVDNTGQGNWQIGTTSNVNYTPALSGNYAYFKSEYNVAHNYNADLISPTFDLSTYSNVTLKFKHLFDRSGTNASTGTISYSADNGITWIRVASYSSADSPNPETVTLNIDGIAGQSQVKFKWNYTCSPTGAYMWAVDDVQVIDNSNFWTGTINIDWFNIGNWSTGAIPTTTTPVVIPSAPVNQPQVNAPGGAVCGNIEIKNGASLTMNASIAYTLSVSGNWNNNGTFTAGKGIVEFNGTNDLQTIAGTSTSTFNVLKVTKGAQSKILEATSQIAFPASPAASPLVITSGTFKLSSASTITPFTTIPTIGNTAGLWNNGGTIDAANVNYLYTGGLIKSSNGTLNLKAIKYQSTTSQTLIEGGIINIAEYFGPNSGTSTTRYEQSGGTVNIDANSWILPFELTHASNVFIMSNGILTIKKRSTHTSDDFKNLSGTHSVTGGTLQIGNASTIAGQIIRINSSVPIYNLVVNSTNAPTAQLAVNPLTIKGDVTIGTGAKIDANSLNLSVGGNWTNGGTFTPGTGTVTCNGTANQTLISGGSGTGKAFYNLAVNNPAGVTLSTNDLSVSNLLTFTSGVVTTDNNKLIIPATGSVSRTSGHVNGNLQKNVATGTAVSHTFEVGDAVETNYAPVTVSFASVTTTGNLVATTVSGDHSSVASSTLNAAKSVNRYWTLVNNGVGFTTYDGTFNFTANDLDASATASNLIAGKFIPSTWTYPTVGTKSATSTQLTGLTSFGDFQLAEGFGKIGMGGNWSSPSTWSDNVVPVVADNVQIASSGTVNVDVANAACNDLSIQSGATLNIAPAKALTVNGTFTNNAGNNGFVLQSDATGTATFLDNGTANTAVAATVQQYLPSVRNWYMSSPVTGAIAPAGNTYYKYVETANDGATWTPVSSGATFDVMTGYTVKPSGATTFAFSGVLNTGAQSISSLTSTATAKTGYNLVGNPYTSYVNWMSATKTNLSTTIWYRTQNSATTPAYVFDTYNETANTGTNNNGVAAVTGMIPPMQAFWVKVNAGTTGTLAFDNSMRSHQDVSTNQFRAPAANATQQTLRLQVSNGTNIDEAIVLFNANAADGYDAYDSPKMTNANASIPEIYTFAGTEKAVINGLNSIATNSLVSLGFSAGAANTFSIKATEVTNFDADTRIVLKDKVLNVEQDITDGTPYNFTSDVTSTDNRFSVVFKSKSSITGIDNSVEKETIIVSKSANNQIVVTNNANTQTGVVMVSNAIGQRLYSAAITGVTTVVTKSFSPGVYLVTVNEGEKHVTKKVIIN